MEKAFILSLVITVVYFVSKLIDMKYISKEWKPMRTVMRESLFVLVSSILSVVVFFLTNGKMSDFFDILTESKTLKPSATEVFTGEPGF
jgi:hypothetical protein